MSRKHKFGPVEKITNDKFTDENTGEEYWKDREHRRCLYCGLLSTSLNIGAIYCEDTKISSFFCFIKDNEEHGRSINATSHSKARYDYWRQVREPYPDVDLIDIRCRKEGTVRNSGMFEHIAKAHGLEHVHCGYGVIMDGRKGTVIGEGMGGSPYFHVQFDDGGSGNIHPLWETTYFDPSGKQVHP